MSNLSNNSAVTPAAPFPWLALTVISIGTFLGPLNGVIVGVALPTISRAFSVDLQSVKWLVLVYLVITTFLLPVVGLLGKRFGETRLFIAGYAICIVGTTACAMAPESDFGLLVAARGLQAVGSACIYALFGALVVRTVPARYRGLGFGLTGASVAISLVVAPILGGVLLNYLSWPWVFWIQLPVQCAGLIMSALVLPRRHAPVPVRFPVLNILSWLGVVCGLVLFVEAFSKGLWREFMPLTGALALAAIVVFGLTERARHKLFDFSLFAIRAFGLGSLGLLLLNTGLFMFMLFTPFLLEDYMGLNQRQMGMFLAIAPLVTLVAAPAAGRLSDRIGYRLLIMLAFICAIGGYGSLAAYGARGSIPMIIAGLVLLGLAGGLFNAPAMSAMMGSVSELQRAQASSLGSLMRNLGFLAGTSLGSLAFSLLILNIGGREMMIAARTAELADAVPGPEFSAAYAATMWVCAGLQLLALVISLRFPRRITAAAQ